MLTVAYMRERKKKRKSHLWIMEGWFDYLIIIRHCFFSIRECHCSLLVGNYQLAWMQETIFHSRFSQSIFNVFECCSLLQQVSRKIRVDVYFLPLKLQISSCFPGEFHKSPFSFQAEQPGNHTS